VRVFFVGAGREQSFTVRKYNPYNSERVALFMKLGNLDEDLKRLEVEA